MRNAEQDHDAESLPWREAARVIVLDPDDAVLLMRYDDGPPNGRHWSTPDGGLDEAEDFETAAKRELEEETGWCDIALLAEVHSRELTMSYAGRLIRQHERLFLARTSIPKRELGDVSAMHQVDRIAAWRWWTLTELQSTNETTWPAELPELIRQSLASHPVVLP